MVMQGISEPKKDDQRWAEIACKQQAQKNALYYVLLSSGWAKATVLLT
jgi:hypothetical protein